MFDNETVTPLNAGPRILVLCTHNSARSQMAEGWLRHFLPTAEVWSAGTEKTRVKPEAVQVMAEVGIDLGSHYSKTLYDIPDPWEFDLVLTVCDEANAACPSYPARTARRHVSVPDPSGEPLEEWRRVREILRRLSSRLAAAVGAGRWPTAAELERAAEAGEEIE